MGTCVDFPDESLLCPHRDMTGLDFGHWPWGKVKEWDIAALAFCLRSAQGKALEDGGGQLLVRQGGRLWLC